VSRFMIGAARGHIRKSTIASLNRSRGSASRVTKSCRPCATKQRKCLSGNSAYWGGCSPITRNEHTQTLNLNARACRATISLVSVC
jgi:hypothetical protein